ncbi:MAG: 16S rRNA (guanine(527)-N(7))-methyltransferase RsmG [Solirubrobacteraceae bacterium]
MKHGLDQLVARYDLPPGSREQLSVLLEALTEDPHAPTTIRDPKQALKDHLADSLVALEFEVVRRAGAIADLGAGAGLPGLPLAIARPEASVTLVESNGRKAEFIARTAEACGLDNVNVVAERVEEWTAGAAACDLITARALAPLAVVAEYAAPLLQIGGTLVAWRGRRDPEDEAEGARAAAELGLLVGDPVRVEPYVAAVNRHLQPVLKISATPDRFPRRPGMARKRPLGGAPRPSSDRRRR